MVVLFCGSFSSLAKQMYMYVDAFVKYILGKHMEAHVYLIVDCYYDLSTTNGTKASRAGQTSRQEVVLTIKHNNTQLIDIISLDILVKVKQLQISDPAKFKQCLVVTSAKETRVEVSNRIDIQRHERC